MVWSIDPTHASVGFAVRHMAISTVRGTFKSFTASGETNAAGVPVSLQMAIDASSVFTNNEQRDAHLRSADFLHAESFPQLSFRSTKVSGELASLTIEGELTIRGVTRPVTLTGAMAPVITDPWGNKRTSLTVSGTIVRSEWGLTWNQALELGGFVVSDEVRLEIEAQAVAHSSTAAAA